jgi:hypothetical protein
VIDEDVELRVRITQKPLVKDTIAHAWSYAREVDIGDFVNLLQRKMHALGYKDMIYPTGETLIHVMGLGGRDPKEEKNIVVSDTILRTILSDAEFRKRFEWSKDFDFSIEMNQNWKPSDFNTELEIAPKDTVSLYTVIIHEVGHALGFTSGATNGS